MAGATFTAMRLRRVLLDAGAFDAAPFADFLDRYAFIAALVIGVAGWLISRRRAHEGLDRRFLPVEAAGTLGFVALVFSIAGGAVVALMAGRAGAATVKAWVRATSTEPTRSTAT